MLFVYVDICIYVYTYMHAWTYLHVYVNVYVCVYVYAYVYTICVYGHIGANITTSGVFEVFDTFPEFGGAQGIWC